MSGLQTGVWEVGDGWRHGIRIPTPSDSVLMSGMNGLDSEGWRMGCHVDSRELT